MPYPLLDPTGWEFHCPHCAHFHSAIIVQERDVFEQTEYFELVCSNCNAVVVTFQRANPVERMTEYIRS